MLREWMKQGSVEWLCMRRSTMHAVAMAMLAVQALPVLADNHIAGTPGMPTSSDYTSMLWEHGPPSAATDDRHWGWSRKGAGESVVPAHVTLKTRSGAACNGYTGCGSTAGPSSPLARWFVSIDQTATSAAGTNGGAWELVGDNGNTFPIYKVAHFAWGGNKLFFHPVASNDQYDVSLLAQYNKLFPPGTTLSVKQRCDGGFDATGAPCGALPSQPSDGLVFETGYFDMNIDPRRMLLQHFAQRPTGASRRDAAATAAFLSKSAGQLPRWRALNLTVELAGAHGGVYRCTGIDDSDWASPYGKNFPVRVVKDGLFQTHVDMRKLRFTSNDDVESSADITGYMEIVVWPRCVSFSASIAVRGAHNGFMASLGVALNSKVSRDTGASGASATDPVSVVVRFCIDNASGKLMHLPTVAQPRKIALPSKSLVPPSVALTISSAASCNTYTGCVAGKTSLARWQMTVADTTTTAAGSSAGKLVIEGDNGARFPIYRVGHFAWQGKYFFVHPVPTNSEYHPSLLAKFNRRFPVGTRFVVRERLAVEAGEDLLADRGSAPLADIVDSKGIVVSEAVHNRTRNSWLLELPAAANKAFPAQLNAVDRYSLRLRNDMPTERQVQLDMTRAPQRNVVGLCPVLLLPNGRPSGIPVQVSKNWHHTPDARTVYDGSWLSLSTVLTLPPNCITNLTLVITFGHWGGVPAASHAQLSLIGWGSNGVWHEAAIGSFGEQICFEPARQQRRSMITDTRPLQQCSLGSTNADCKRYGWTNNVGGGDTMLYFDEAGVYQYAKQSRATIHSPGPCLTNTSFEEVSANGALAHKVTVALGRTTRYTKSYQHLQLHVLHDTTVGRLAFHQLGADGYNENVFEGVAFGNGSTVEHFAPSTLLSSSAAPAAGYLNGGYTRRACGSFISSGYKRGSCWAFLPSAPASRGAEKAASDRALIIREWRAVLGGKVVGPHVSLYKTGATRAGLEVSLPPGINVLKSGDFVDAQIEVIVLPPSAADYYGTDADLRNRLRQQDEDLADFPDAGRKVETHWHVAAAEAQENSASVEVLEGKLENAHPVRVQVNAVSQSAKFSIAGGVGYVPIAISGLRAMGEFRLLQRVGADDVPWSVVDQSSDGGGHDFWQSDYDTGSGQRTITFNVPMQASVSVEFHFQMVSFPATATTSTTTTSAPSTSTTALSTTAIMTTTGSIAQCSSKQLSECRDGCEWDTSTSPPACRVQHNAKAWKAMEWKKCSHIHCKLSRNKCSKYHLFQTDEHADLRPSFRECMNHWSIRVQHHTHERHGRMHRCFVTAEASECKCMCGSETEADPLIMLGDQASGLEGATNTICRAAGHAGTHKCKGDRIHTSPASKMSWMDCRLACGNLGATCMRHGDETQQCDCFDGGGQQHSAIYNIIGIGGRMVEDDHKSQIMEPAFGGRAGFTTAYCESDTTNVNGTQALLWYTMAAKMGSEYAVMRIKQLKYAWHMHAHMMHYDPDAFCRLEDPNAIASVAHVVRDYTGDCQCRQGYWKVSVHTASADVTMDSCQRCPEHASSVLKPQGTKGAQWSCTCQTGYKLGFTDDGTALVCLATDSVDGF